MTTAIAVIVILAILVLVHEIGHFAVARFFGVKVHEFGIGLPPRGIGWTRIDGKWKKVTKENIKEGSVNTIYSLNLTPLGGFVKIKGEDGEDANDPDSFAVQAVWKRGLVISAGVIMNIITAAVLFSLVFMLGLRSPVSDVEIADGVVEQVEIAVVDVLPDSPAQVAGFVSTDQIQAIDGTAVDSISDIQEQFKQKEGQSTTVRIQRGDQPLELFVVPEQLSEAAIVGIGVGLDQTGIRDFTFFEAIEQGVKQTGFLIVQIFKAFGGAIATLWTDASSPVDVAGPVGIVVLTGEIVKLGIVPLIQFTALLSVNLAILNILPVPALDGGRLLFLIIEGIKGSPVNRRVEGYIHSIGLYILIGLIALVTLKDILGIFR